MQTTSQIASIITIYSCPVDVLSNILSEENFLIEELFAPYFVCHLFKNMVSSRVCKVKKEPKKKDWFWFKQPTGYYRNEIIARIFKIESMKNIFSFVLSLVHFDYVRDYRALKYIFLNLGASEQYHYLKQLIKSCNKVRILGDYGILYNICIGLFSNSQTKDEKNILSNTDTFASSISSYSSSSFSSSSSETEPDSYSIDSTDKFETEEAYLCAKKDYIGSRDKSKPKKEKRFKLLKWIFRYYSKRNIKYHHILNKQDQSEIVSNIAGSGSIEATKWIVKEKNFHYTNAFLKNAAGKGQLSFLKMIKQDMDKGNPHFRKTWGMCQPCYNSKNGVQFSNSLFIDTTNNGHVDVIQWLLKHNYKFNDMAVDGAIENGHLNILEIFVENGILLTSKIFEKSAICGHVHIIEWLIEKNCPLPDGFDYSHNNPYYLVKEVSKKGHIDVLKILLINMEYPYDDSVFNEAVKYDKQGVALWLVENKFHH
jgi:hypothetical protein